MNVSKAMITALSLTLLTACATQDKKLDEKVAQTPVKTDAQLRTESADLIKDSTSLKPEQKDQLLALRESTRKQMAELQVESIKLRELLIEDVLTKNYNSKEVATIKRRMRKNEDKRLALIFSTVDDANKVLGREPVHQRAMILNDMMTPIGTHTEI